MLGQLYAGRADASRSSDDQKLVSILDVSQVPEVMQCGVGTKGNGNGILPAQRVWFNRQGRIFVEAYVLSVRAARHSGRAEDLVSWLEPRNVFADSHDLSRQLCSEDA